MHQQNQIKRTLALPDSIEVVRSLLNSQVHKNRASVSKAVCHHFNFSDARGRPQIGGCVKALRELERVGHFVLPAPSKATTLKKPRRLDCAVPNPVEVPAQAGNVQGLRLIKVDSLDLMRVWNEMMLREHPHRHALDAMKLCRSSMAPRMLAQYSSCDEQRFVPHSCLLRAGAPTPAE